MAVMREPIAYLCAAVLIWTGIAAVLVAPSNAMAVNAAGAAIASYSIANHHTTADHATAHHAVSGEAVPAHHEALDLNHRSLVCIASCLESIEAKLLPKVAESDPRTEPIILPVQWPRDVLGEQFLQQLPLAYWPAGPPGGTLASGTGIERLLALNARMRN